MCRLRNIAMRDYQENVTTGQTDTQTDGRTDGQTDAGQSDPYLPLCFAGDTKITIGLRFPPSDLHKGCHLPSLTNLT